MCDVLIDLANAERTAGQFRAAQVSAAEALEIAQQDGYRLVEGQALTALTMVALESGRFDDVACLGEQALAIHCAIGHRLGEARTRLVLGRASQGGDAGGHLARALDLFEEIGYSR